MPLYFDLNLSADVLLLESECARLEHIYEIVTKLEEKNLNTGFQRFEQNLMDVVKESQIKLGYAYSPMQLYYPLTSLNHTFQTELDEESMNRYLEEFRTYTKDRLGEVGISSNRGRFQIVIPADGVKYVHEHVEASPFLVELVMTSAAFGCTEEDLIAVFHKYSDHVVRRHVDNGEFDDMIYFEDGKPDDYYYCLHNEGDRVIYHRFKKEDTEELL